MEESKKSKQQIQLKTVKYEDIFSSAVTVGNNDTVSVHKYKQITHDAR